MTTLSTYVTLAAVLVLLSRATAAYAHGAPVPPSPASAQAQDHAHHGGGQGQGKPGPGPTGHDDHATHRKSPGPKEYPPGIPPITDEDRAAAFPELNGRHTAHDQRVSSYVLFDQLEWQAGKGATAGNWDARGWIGGDVHRFWFRTEGDAEDSRIGEAQAHALLGRAIHPWWDVVVGVRQDFGPGPGRTWAAFGIQGLAPYWFEVEATAYIGESGRTHLRLETEYELLFTNRLILQPLVELEVYGKADPERGIGAGVSTAEAGLRLRYEVRREFAPYVGVTWSRKFFGTADFAQAAGGDTSSARVAMGVRVWF